MGDSSERKYAADMLDNAEQVDPEAPSEKEEEEEEEDEDADNLDDNEQKWSTNDFSYEVHTHTHTHTYTQAHTHTGLARGGGEVGTAVTRDQARALRRAAAVVSGPVR